MSKTRLVITIPSGGAKLEIVNGLSKSISWAIQRDYAIRLREHQATTKPASEAGALPIRSREVLTQIFDWYKETAFAGSANSTSLFSTIEHFARIALAHFAIKGEKMPLDSSA